MLQGTTSWYMVGPAPVAAPVAVDQRIHDLWTSPHGVLKASLKNKATATQRSVEVHQIAKSIHADGFLMVYLPTEKLLVQADAYTPSAPNTPPPAKPNDNHLTLISNIEERKLNVERILPLHGRMVPLAVLYTTAGRKQ
jgi:glyoxylase-like metal-dependent hydrolase (beta-lactamase superfamily II)